MTDDPEIHRYVDDGCPHHDEDSVQPSIDVQDELAEMCEFAGISSCSRPTSSSSYVELALQPGVAVLGFIVVPITPAALYECIAGVMGHDGPQGAKALSFCSKLVDALAKAGYVVPAQEPRPAGPANNEETNG